MFCFPTIRHSYVPPVTVTQLLALTTDTQKLQAMDAVGSSRTSFSAAFAASLPFGSQGWSHTGSSVATDLMDSLNNLRLTIWGATWGGHMRCHQRTREVPNELNMIMWARGSRRGLGGWDEGMVSTACALCIHITFLGFLVKMVCRTSQSSYGMGFSPAQVAESCGGP